MLSYAWIPPAFVIGVLVGLAIGVGFHSQLAQLYTGCLNRRRYREVETFDHGKRPTGIGLQSFETPQVSAPVPVLTNGVNSRYLDAETVDDGERQTDIGLQSFEAPPVPEPVPVQTKGVNSRYLEVDTVDDGKRHQSFEAPPVPEPVPVHTKGVNSSHRTQLSHNRPDSIVYDNGGVTYGQRMAAIRGKRINGHRNGFNKQDGNDFPGQHFMNQPSDAPKANLSFSDYFQVV